jgi:hypothetical protein
MTGTSVGDGSDDDLNEVHRLMLRDALSRVDPSALTRHELLMMANILGEALAAFGDPPSNLGDDLIV